MSSTLARIRIAVLLAVLVLVLVYAWHDVNQRRSRRDWAQPLPVALVLVRMPHAATERTTSDVAVNQLRQRTADLSRQLAREFARYRPGAHEPFQFSSFGPAEVLRAPPALDSDSLWDAAVHAFELWRYTRLVDCAASVPTRAFASRIYVVVEPVTHAEQRLVEGFSEQGGRVGVARVQLDESSVDLGLFVVAHELMHTLGASDKYAQDGSTKLPEGLGDPDLSPSFPQARAEVMARNRVLAPGREAVPESLDQLAVGLWTAREIGWVSE